MENVKKRGFVMYDKMRILPLVRPCPALHRSAAQDHFLLAMTNLAHFHGRWLAYKWLRGTLGEQAWSEEQWRTALNTQKRVPKFVYNQLVSTCRSLLTDP